MKKLMIYMGIIFMTGFGLSSCYKDILLPEAAVDPDAPPKSWSYKNDIAPLVNSKCALSGCHVSGSHKPYLKLDESYLQIIGGGFINTNLPRESIIYKEINGGMQEYIPSAADRQKIYDWIRTGALNN